MDKSTEQMARGSNLRDGQPIQLRVVNFVQLKREVQNQPKERVSP